MARSSCTRLSGMLSSLPPCRRAGSSFLRRSTRWRTPHSPTATTSWLFCLTFVLPCSRSSWRTPSLGAWPPCLSLSLSEPPGTERDVCVHVYVPACFLLCFSVGEASGGFHALRQFVWWRGDSLLAIGESGDVGGQHLVQFSLDVDRDNKLVKVTKW